MKLEQAHLAADIIKTNLSSMERVLGAEIQTLRKTVHSTLPRLNQLACLAIVPGTGEISSGLERLSSNEKKEYKKIQNTLRYLEKIEKELPVVHEAIPKIGKCLTALDKELSEKEKAKRSKGVRR